MTFTVLSCYHDVMSRRRRTCVTFVLALLFLLLTYSINLLLHTDVIHDYHDVTHHDVTIHDVTHHDVTHDDVINDVKQHVVFYNLSAGYKADFHCVTMRTDPPTPVCLYNQWNDMYISHDLEFTGMWEPHVMADLQEALRRDTSLGLIDVGANIGVYSLLAANMGRQVVAVEPNIHSLYRLHRAAVMATSQHNIIALNNAVSDYRGVATLRRSGDNQGDTRILPGYEDCIGSCPTKVKVILLDDIRFVTSSKRAVLKIDIQGEEERAVVHIERLMDAVNVPYIYMEWLLMKTNSTSNHQAAVTSLINTLTHRHYKPYRLNTEGATQLTTHTWQHWPNDIVWRHLPSHTEYKKLMRNHFLHWP